MVLRHRSKRRHSRGCKSRNRKGGKKSRRRVKKRRKTRRRKSRKSRRRRRRKRMRGGSGCPYNKNLGEQFTLRPYNNLSGPTPRGGYISTNSNSSVPHPYQSGGGGTTNLAQGLGLGDLWQGYYGLGNSFSNVRHAWGGKPDEESHKPMKQNLESDEYFHQIPDIKSYHDRGVIAAANKGSV